MPYSPNLDSYAFTRAFPFYVQIAQNRQIIAAGPSLIKMLGASLVGTLWTERFEIVRPQGVDIFDLATDLPQHYCVLNAIWGDKFILKGGMERGPQGSVLLLVSPAITQEWNPAKHGLKLNDFAKHDMVADAMLLIQSTQLSLNDATRMSTRLRHRTDQLSTILELSSNGAIHFDSDMRVSNVNSALLRMFGLERSNLLGLSLTKVDALLAEHMVEDAEAMKQPLQRKLDMLSASKDATYIELRRPSVATLQITVANAGEAGTVFYFRDVTKEFEIDRMKTEFLSTAAHELRTPMVSILGFSELMLKRNYPEAKQRDMLETIHRQCSLLVQIVNELLDLARIESRRGLDLKVVPTSLKELINDSIKGLMVPAEGRQVKVGHIPSINILADASKTQLALRNLLSNAYKYSPAGGEISLNCEMAKQGDVNYVRIRVTDQGIGMTPEQLRRVFERFYRADASGNIPGTGLGLALVKEIAELQQGKVDIESSAGVGTTATLWMPVSVRSVEAAPVEQTDAGALPIS